MTVKRTTSPMTRNQRKKSSEVPSEVKIRKVVPEVPRDETDDRIVRELLDGVTNEFNNTIRATPIQWSEECWREVYNFNMGGSGLAGRKDEYVKDYFKELPSPKDGTRSRTAWIRITDGCSHFLFQFCIRKSQTG
jgi:hypothetical protein